MREWTIGRAKLVMVLVGVFFLVCLLFGWNGTRFFVIGSVIFMLLLILAIRVVPSAEDNEEPLPPPLPPPGPPATGVSAAPASAAPNGSGISAAAAALASPSSSTPGAAVAGQGAAGSFKHQFGQEIRRALFFETLILAAAMLLQWWAYPWLAVHRDTLPTFIPSSEFALHALVVVAAVMAAGVGVLLLLAPAILLVIYIDYWNLADSPGASPQTPLGNRWTRSLRRSYMIVLGLSQGTIILEKGKLYQPDGRTVAVCAGPAFLDVREAQVAVIESRGRIDRAVGRGRYWLAGNQRVTGITDLNIQYAPVTLEDVSTHDGQTIKSLDLSVIYTMGLGNRRQPEGQRPVFDPSIVENELWRDTPETYKRMVRSLTENAARTVIGDYDLHNIVILPSPNRMTVCQAIADRIQRIIDTESRIVVVNIGRVELDEKTRHQLADRWIAEMEQGTGLIRAETAKETLILKGEGQAVAVGKVEQVKHVIRKEIIRQIAGCISGRSGVPVTLRPQLAERYLQAVETLTAHLATEDVHAWQLVEALEQMAKSGKAVSFYVGEDSMLLKQQRRADEEPGNGR